jgi:hypothetical protein
MKIGMLHGQCGRGFLQRSASGLSAVPHRFAQLTWDFYTALTLAKLAVCRNVAGYVSYHVGLGPLKTGASGHYPAHS